MSASWIGNMSPLRVKVPLLLLLLLATVLPGTVFGQDENEDAPEEQSGSDKLGNEPATTGESVSSHKTASRNAATDNDTDSTQTSSEGSGSINATPTDDSSIEPTESPSLDPIIIIIPAALVVVVIFIIVCCIFINRRWKKQKRNPDLNKEDPYLDGSSTEKVPMPMFEEDVPSVLELEMEELDEWMKKDLTAEDSKHL